MKVYTIKRGDSLFVIAKKVYGDGNLYTQLATYNNISDPNAVEVGQKLKIPKASDLQKAVDGLGIWHNYAKGEIWWRVTEKGVEIKNTGVVRSLKYSERAKEIWGKFQDPILTASQKYHVPVPVIIATISTESSGNPNAYRYEPLFYKRYIKNQKQWKNSPYYRSPRRISASYGLMQIMYTTAYRVGFRGQPDDLYDPAINIDAGAAYIASAYQVKHHKWDPPKIACAYNAGNVRATAKNDWGMFHHPGHLDRWIPSYNGAIEVVDSSEAAVSSQPPASQPENVTTTLRFFFPQPDGEAWKPMVVDLFKHNEQGIDEPITFTITTATPLRKGGFSYDLPNIVKGQYDAVFVDEATFSVVDDRENIRVKDSPTILDLRDDAGTSRSAPSRKIVEKATVRLCFPNTAWKPVFIDLFPHEGDDFGEPLSVHIETPPSEQGGKYVHNVLDVEYGLYDIEVTDAETLEIVNEMTDYDVNRPMMTCDIQSPSPKLLSESLEEVSLGELLRASWKKFWENY